MNKLSVILRASYLQLKLYLYVILGVVAISVLSTIIVSLSIGPGGNTQVSAANVLTVFLIFVGSILPVQLFRRVLSAATRIHIIFLRFSAPQLAERKERVFKTKDEYIEEERAKFTEGVVLGFIRSERIRLLPNFSRW